MKFGQNSLVRLVQTGCESTNNESACPIPASGAAAPSVGYVVTISSTGAPGLTKSGRSEARLLAHSGIDGCKRRR